MKLRELREFLNGEDFKGKEDHEVLLSRDNEGNSYHRTTKDVAFGAMKKVRYGWEDAEAGEAGAVECIILYPAHD